MTRLAPRHYSFRELLISGLDPLNSMGIRKARYDRTGSQTLLDSMGGRKAHYDRTGSQKLRVPLTFS